MHYWYFTPICIFHSVFRQFVVFTFFYLARDLLENWVHVSFLRCSISTWWLVVWPTSTHFCQCVSHSETRPFESGFQWRDGMRKPEGMGGGRASQVRKLFAVLGMQGVCVADAFARRWIACLQNGPMLFLLSCQLKQQSVYVSLQLL